MSDQIGARLSSLEESAGVMDATGAESAEVGARASEVAQRMNEAVVDATETMRTHIDEAADRSRQSIQRAHNSLMQTEWHGAARERAEGLEAELSGEVEQVVSTAQQRAEEFKREMMTRAAAELEEINSAFRDVMERIRERYESFGAEERATAQRLTDADSSSFA